MSIIKKEMDNILSKEDYNIIIACMTRQRNIDNSLLSQCMNTAYFEDFPNIIDIRKKEVQKMNEIIIKLQILRNSKDGAH